MNSRCVSSVEAYWRIKKFNLFGHYPSVVHEENSHPVVFDEKADLKNLLKTKLQTQLSEWFGFIKKNKSEYPLRMLHIIRCQNMLYGQTNVGI